jgi:hypothetical protein
MTDDKTTFLTTLYKLGDYTILRLPNEASAKLPTRGQVMVAGSINGLDFRSPLEPDGKWSHWMDVPKKIQASAKIKAGDSVRVKVQAIKDWDEPVITADLQSAHKANPKAKALWDDVTTLARWEWIRWIRGTKSAETRQKRIKVGMSKLSAGKRRPCCWNRNACSLADISKNGVLLDAKNLT